MANFPASLPAPAIANYSLAPDNAVMRTDMDKGPARQRRMFTAVPKKLELAWALKAEEMQTFVDFFENDVHHGADYFQMLLDVGRGFQLYSARFIEPYKANKSAKLMWAVAAKIEVENA